MPRCKSCGAGIIWIKTEKGKMTPVDEKLERRYIFTGTEAGKFGEDVPIGKIVATYKPHHATCPSVEQHRRKAAADGRD